MEDGLPSARTTAERLSILHARQTAWSRLAWTANEHVPNRGGDLWNICGNVFARSEGKKTLYFKQIPSAIRGIEGTEWVITDLGCKMTNIAMDPTQDLLVVFERFESGWV